jgi:ABC-type sugar transport system ATPase subunit
MKSIRLDSVAKSFESIQVIKPLDLTIEPGEFTVFVGPSGCGKSTLLRMIAGLEPVSGGRILIGDRDVTALPPVDREVAMVFQSYALYPHMTVGDNIAFGLKIAGMPKAERRAKAMEAAKLLQLDKLFDRKPRALSGGQRQRVAIGRAIVKKPQVFLFDEPLSNLDAELRVQMRLEIGKLHRDVQATMIYVTHDQVEAMTMADKIVVLRDGRVEQVGTPRELYHNPRNEFVAGFIGSPKMNFLPGRIISISGEGTVVVLDHFGGTKIIVAAVSVTGKGKPGDIVKLGARPEHLRPDIHGNLTATIASAEDLGNVSYLYADIGGERPLCIEARDGEFRGGEQVRLSVDAKAAILLDAAGNRW